MKIRNIHVQKFRNHTQTRATFSKGINAVLGENGEGKTNLLEAISYLCLTKSFFGSADALVLQVGENRFEVSGELEADTGAQYLVGVWYDRQQEEKKFSVNKSVVAKLSDVVGLFPVVVLAPESAAITSGGPTERRRFLDFVISQASKVYLEDLLEYRRVLRHRNKILFSAKVERTDPARLLEPWDEELIDRGARIIHRRQVFTKEMQPFIEDAYVKIAGRGEEPSIQYQPAVAAGEDATVEAIQEQFGVDLRRLGGEERKLGLTLVGPHRDEVELMVQRLGVRSHASQGQHKTLLLALKIAEFIYLREKRDEGPILLLDDMFTELDARRANRLLQLIEGIGQVFVTATSDSAFPSKFNWAEKHKRFLVHRGTVQDERAPHIAH